MMKKRPDDKQYLISLKEVRQPERRNSFKEG